MTIVTTYKAFAATYATQHAVPGSVKRPAMPSSTKRDIEEEEDERARLASLPSPCGRQNIISDEELTTQHALLECVGNQSSAPPVVRTIEERVPESKEFKVGSWGSSDKNKRFIREKMVESGIYLVSDWGKHGVNRRRINAVQSIRVGDILHVPMYTQGYEYVGTVKGSMTMISYETIQQNYPEISQATWGNGGPAVNETFMQFSIQWNKVPLTDKSKNELKRMVKDGGRCLETNATIIRLK